MNPEVRTTFERRFKIVSAIRRYMEDMGFYEVETPFNFSGKGRSDLLISSKESTATDSWPRLVRIIVPVTAIQSPTSRSHRSAGPTGRDITLTVLKIEH